MNDKHNGSVMRRAEQVLRSRILQCGDGEFLGSEAQLIESLGVSRPTFRQVAKLLERDLLLEIRRGVGGGYYACNPSIQAVAQAASVFLQFEKSTLRHATVATSQLTRELVRLAAQCSEDVSRQRLQHFLDADRKALAQGQSLATFIEAELRFVETLAAMADNPVLELLVTILYQFATPAVGGVIFDDPDFMRTSRGTRIRTAEAVLAGDAELATLMFRRHMDAQYAQMKKLRGDAGLDVPLF
jgi:DNA-binding FadR family transcriptional regulator